MGNCMTNDGEDIKNTTAIEVNAFHRENNHYFEDDSDERELSHSRSFFSLNKHKDEKILDISLPTQKRPINLSARSDSSNRNSETGGGGGGNNNIHQQNTLLNSNFVFEIVNIFEQLDMNYLREDPFTDIINDMINLLKDSFDINHISFKYNYDIKTSQQLINFNENEINNSVNKSNKPRIQRSSINYINNNNNNNNKKNNNNEYKFPLYCDGYELGDVIIPKNKKLIKITQFHEKLLESVLYFTSKIIQLNYSEIQSNDSLNIIHEAKKKHNINDLICNLCNIIKNSIKCEEIQLYLVDTSLKIIKGLYPSKLKINQFNNGLLGYIAKTKQIIAENDIMNKKKILKKENLNKFKLEDNKLNYIMDSVIGVPIVDDDSECIGILLALNRESDSDNKKIPFTNMDIRLMESLSYEIANVLIKYSTELELMQANEDENNGLKLLLNMYNNTGLLQSAQQSKNNNNNSSSENDNSLKSKFRNRLDSLQSQSGDSIVNNSSSHLRSRLHSNRSLGSPKMLRIGSFTEHEDEEATEEKELTLLSQSHVLQDISHFDENDDMKDKEEISLIKDNLPVASILKNKLSDNNENDNNDNDNDSTSRSQASSENDALNGKSIRARENILKLKVKLGEEQRRGSTGRLKMASIMDPYTIKQLIKNEKLNPLIKICENEFNVFEYNNNQLNKICIEIFKDLNLINLLNINVIKLKSFIIDISKNYNNNPYHNWKHGFSVFAFSYMFLKKQTNLSNNLSNIDKLSLLISSLAHDIDHPGNTNDYELWSNSKLSHLHNDISILENHHCNILFKLFNKSDNKFINFDKNNNDNNDNNDIGKYKYRKFRNQCIESILHTDMKFHFDMIKILQSNNNNFDNYTIINNDNYDNNDNNLNNITYKNSQIQNILNLILHTGDLSAQTLPYNIADKWGKLIAKEFTLQVKKEKKLNLQHKSMMLNLDNKLIYLKSQLGFYDFVLKPLFKIFIKFYPSLSNLYINLMNNRLITFKDIQKLEIKLKENKDNNNYIEPSTFKLTQEEIDKALLKYDTNTNSINNSGSSDGDLLNNTLNSLNGSIASHISSGSIGSPAYQDDSDNDSNNNSNDLQQQLTELHMSKYARKSMNKPNMLLKRSLTLTPIDERNIEKQLFMKRQNST